MTPKSALLPACAWLLASACGPGVATPMPEPPTVFDLSGVNKSDISPATKPADPAVLQILGAAGTVPAGSVVRVTNLDSLAPVSANGAGPRGDFEIDLIAADGEELRFEWVKDAQRSAPADALLSRPDPTGAVFGLTPSPRFDCLKLSPGLAVDFGTAFSATLNVENACTGAVTLANPRTRLAVPDFPLPTSLPQDVAAGTSTELELDVAPGATGSREDTLFLDVTLAGVTIRYAITLRAD
jgi:hypothetical protein